jgi:hypothetical protein
MPAASYWQSGDPITNFNDAPSGTARHPELTQFPKGANVGAKYIVIKSTVAARALPPEMDDVSYTGGSLQENLG